MSLPPEKSSETSKSQPAGLHGRAAWLGKHRWVTFVVPFVVFMAFGPLEPKPPGQQATDLLGLSYAAYPWVYTAKIAAVAVAMWFVWPGYRRFPWRVSAWGGMAGLAGAVVWIGLCQLGLEERILTPLGLGRFVDLGTRSAFNPFEQIADPTAAWAFLTVRFVGLVAVVAVIEEFLLRGFVMRLFVDPDWPDVPFGDVNVAAVLVGAVIYPVLTHPAEAFAAIAWFSLVTLVMVRTRNIWDCVVAHGITNLLLGLWVLYSGEWHLM